MEQKNEAFTTQGAVNYVCRAGRFIDSPAEYPGAVYVFKNIMRFEYLWFNIRVQGGAYGCMCNSTLDGDAFFVSYRDPNLERTNDIYEGIPEYLENFDADEREMTKYVIGTMSDADAPLTPNAKGSRDMLHYLSGMDYEYRRKVREQMISCTREDIRNLAPLYRRALGEGNICVVGNEKSVEGSAGLFKNVRSLFE